MINIEYFTKLDQQYTDLIDVELKKEATKKKLTRNYKSFAFIAKKDKQVIGIITGKSYYQEIHISELIVLEQFRHQNIGTKLINAVEAHFQNKNFNCISLTTYHFQAPKFYQKCGFTIEFIRENKEIPELTRYYLVKYL